MYNLLMAGGGGYWEEREVAEFEWSRFLEHTEESIAQPFRSLDDSTITKLLSYPALFLPEFAKNAHASGAAEESQYGYVGSVVELRRRAKEIQFKFKFDDRFDRIPVPRIRDMAWDLDINLRNGENTRSHWAIKDVDLIEVLKHHGAITETLPVAPEIAAEMKDLAVGTTAPPAGPKQKIFIVHGRDDGIKNEIARWLAQIGLEEVILHEQPNLGRAIVGKFSDLAAEAAYAVVIMTPDDIGGFPGQEMSARARQNVIFELGFFLGALGPSRVGVILAGAEIEKPSDYDGVVYTPYDRAGAWKLALAREFRALAIPFDPMRAF